MTPTTPMETVVQAYFTAVDTEDWTGLAELWTPDAELHAVGARPRIGRVDVLGYFSGLFDPWQHHVDEPRRVIPAEETVTVEVRFSGVTQDGRAISFDALDLFDIHEDRICRLSTWYDLLLVRRLLAGESRSVSAD